MSWHSDVHAVLKAMRGELTELQQLREEVKKMTAQTDALTAAVNASVVANTAAISAMSNAVTALSKASTPEADLSGLITSLQTSQGQMEVATGNLTAALTPPAPAAG